MRYGFGVDIFGSNVKFGLFDEKGNLLDRWKIAPAVVNNGNQLLMVISDELERYMQRRGLFEHDILGVGVGIPGPVSNEGTVNRCVNLGWGVFNVDRALAGLTGLNVKSSNIANMSALGECWKGSGTSNSVFFAMNMGLGGAVVCNGAVVYGAHGGGGEFGHIMVNPKETEHCTCGRRGCAEQYVSPPGIVRLTKRQLSGSLTPSVLRKHPFFTYADVLEAAAAGDKVAVASMNQVYDYAGHVLAGVCCVTNPDTIVLGGEFCKIGQPAIEGINRAFHKYVFPANENVRFVLAKLGTDACVYGAFKTVLDTFA